MNQREVFAVELQNALAELGRVGRERADCLSNWAELRRLLQAQNGENGGLRHDFEKTVVCLREHDQRLEEAKRRVREADRKLGNAVVAWGLKNRMELSRSHS